MQNMLRALRRDIVRLVKTPAALAVALALAVLPSAYTWYNVVAFWDPYGNTGNVRVCVVNEDEGAKSEEIGSICVGDMIEDELRGNSQLAWVFTDESNAMEEVSSGKSYAAFVIPENFSERFTSLLSGDFEQPVIEYYVNEKAGAVSPKITDAGATTLDETINSTFVETVSDAVVEQIGEAALEERTVIESARSHASEKAGEIAQALEEARTALENAGETAAAAQQGIESAKQALANAQRIVDEASRTLEDVSKASSAAQSVLETFSSDILHALGNAAQSGADASSEAVRVANAIATGAHNAHVSLDSVLVRMQTVLDEGDAVADHLRSLSDSLPEGNPAKAALADTVSRIEEANASARDRIESLGAINDKAMALDEAASEAAASVGDAMQNAASEIQGLSTLFVESALPSISEGLARISTASSQLAIAISNAQNVIDESSLLLDALSATASSAHVASQQTADLIEGVEDDFASVRTDIAAISGSSIVSKLAGISGLDTHSIASFISAPTQVETEQLYPLNAYGSAMAPLFMNLTFWIGAFMLVVVMKQEVDDEGVEGITLAQRYLSRFALFALICLLQAGICCTGVIAIGVEAASVPALYAASAVASLTYLSIIYALSITLQHIGKGLCVVLVFAQIPGATGLYPVELTSPFFQAVYPFFPFTYGIGAMREAICGFYGAHFAMDLAALGVFLVSAMAFGLIVRPLMANVNHMVADQVREGGIYNGEAVEAPVRPYRISQIIRVLTEKESYRIELAARRERFNRRYPKLMRAAVIAGFAVPTALAIVLSLTPTEKVVLLTAWLAWMVAAFVFIIVVESLRRSIDRQAALESVPDDQVIQFYTAAKTDAKEKALHEEKERSIEAGDRDA